MVFEFGCMEGRGSRGKWKVLEIGGMMEVRDMEQKSEPSVLDRSCNTFRRICFERGF